MFVPYFRLYMHSDSYDKWEPGFEFAELPAHDENAPLIFKSLR